MAETRVLTFYIFFLIIFSTFAGGFSLLGEGEDFDVKSFGVVNKARDRLNNADNIIASVFSVVLVPFVLIDLVIFLFVAIGHSFSIVPTILQVILLSPLGVVITFDYILPYFRGN